MTSRLLLLVVALVAVLGTAGTEAAQEAQTPRAVVATLNINTASPEQFEALPGIGAKTAQRIIEHRQKNGPFKKIEELMNVKGIGEKSFLKLKPYLSVAAPKGDRVETGVRQ